MSNNNPNELNELFEEWKGKDFREVLNQRMSDMEKLRLTFNTPVNPQLNNFASVSSAVTEKHICKYNLACFNTICIDPNLCLKQHSELTDEERNEIEQFNNEQ